MTSETKAAIITTKEGIILKVTPTAAKLLDQSPDTLIGQPVPFSLTDAWLNTNASSRVAIQVIEVGDYYTIVLNVTHCDYDATTQKQQRQSEFIGMLSHELKNPLASIQLSADLLMRHKGKLSAKKQEVYFKRILHKVECISDLLDDILSISSTTEPDLRLKPEIVDLRELCRELIDEQVARYSHVTFDVFFKEKLGYMMLDPRLFRYIIANLLSNAAKYSPSDRVVHLNIDFENSTLFIVIKDEGRGMTATDISHLYIPFYRGSTTKDIAGTGLGLATVKHSVDAHGGTIHFDSIEGQGTTVTVNLPANEMDNLE